MMRRRLASLRHAREGAAMVEFALIAPILFGFVFGVVEYGRLYWTREALAQTAITAARCMGILASNCAAGGTFSSANTTTYIQQVGNGWGISIPAANVHLDPTATCAGVANLSQVSLSVTFRSVVPAIVHLASAGNTLNATACFPNNPP